MSRTIPIPHVDGQEAYETHVRFEQAVMCAAISLDLSSEYQEQLGGFGKDGALGRYLPREPREGEGCAEGGSRARG